MSLEHPVGGREGKEGRRGRTGREGRKETQGTYQKDTGANLKELQIAKAELQNNDSTGTQFKE